MKSNPPSSLVPALAILLVTHPADFAEGAGAVPGTILPPISGQCVAPPAGLVGWWKGDGDLTTAVGSANGTAAERIAYASGMVGRAFDLRGLESGIQLGKPAAFELQDLTVEAWIRRSDPTYPSPNWPHHAAILSGGTGNWGFALLSDGRLTFSKIGTSRVDSSGSVIDLSWHHVAVTKSGTQVRFYIDGQPAGVGSLEGVFSFSTPFALGALGETVPGTGTEPFGGLIDELSLFSNAISSEAIASNYNSGIMGKCAIPAPQPLRLANATATYSQGLVQSFPPFPVTQSIDGLVIENHNGWAIYPRQGVPETAVWESTQDAGFVGGTFLTFKIQSSGHLGHHGLGRFRLSVTTDPRTEFADGQISNGDVTANWTVLPVTRATSSEGTILTLQTDGSLLASGNNPFSDTYTVEAFCSLTGITGFRLEALPDASLPMGGPGRDFEGNFVLSEIEVTATPSGPASPTPTCVPAPSGLVAWYRGEGNSTDSLNAHVTTFATPRYAAGKVGQALEFDGSNEVVIPDAPDLNFAAFTAEAWVFPTSVDGDVDIIMNKELNGFDTIAFEFGIKGPWSQNVTSIPTGNLAVMVGGVNGMPSDYSGWSDGGASVPLNAWSHVVLSYGEGVARVYLNGALVRTFGGLTGSLRTTPGPLKIGSRSDPIVQVFPTSRFNGLIDEASLYSRALAESEVSRLFQAGSMGKCSSGTLACTPATAGLLAWYRGEDDANDQAGPREGNFAGAQYAPGKVGRAFDFSGANEVVIPDSPEFNGSTFTLEAWVNPTKLDGAVDIIVNKEAGQQFSDFQFEFGIKGPVQEVPGSILVGNLAFFLGGVDGLPNDYGGWTDGLAAIPLNEWTHVALAVEPGGVSVFVNGVETRRLTNLTGSVRSTTGPLRIGSRSEGFTSFRPEERFNGRIDEFSFYTRRLTQPEVAAVYNAGAEGKCFYSPADTEAPALALAEPATGTVTDDRFNLRGTAADNVAVTSLTWSWNGAAQGSLSLSGGQFAANGLILNAGLNTFVVTASDAAGYRTSVTREVTLAALRTLRVSDATEVQEGKRISFPIVLESPGDVGGMTFRLNYDSAYLTEPQLDWGSEVGQSVNNVNATVAGELSASFALPGTSLPTGATPVATVSFRARSVPFALATELTARIDSLSSATGASLPRGNAVVAGNGRIKPRKIIADNNANQRLDIGDAVVVSRLQVGLEEQRSWDIGLNDLNGSANIDSGDIVKVLRTVVGLDLQPTPSGGSARQAVSRAAVSPNDRVVLEFPDGPVAHIGQPYSIVVKVAKAGGNLSGLSFVVDYPAALSLSARQVGALVPAGTLPLWNSAAGTVQLAAVSPTAWPANEGVAAVLTFVPQADFATQAAWPLQLRQIELTGSGFDVRAAEDVNAIVKSVVIPANAPTLALLPQSDGNLRLEVRAEAGFDVVVEHSANLTDWTETQVAVGAGLTQPVTLNLSPVAEAKFWRARNR